MTISRNLSVKINRLLDQLIPPLLRDQKFIVKPVYRLILKDKVEFFLNFKENAFAMSEKEFIETNRSVSAVLIERKTDLNDQCFDEIMNHIVGEKVLEIGCGRGHLANEISKTHSVTACDIVIDKSLYQRYPSLSFKEANIEHLPFADAEFDTVICTHTLEHVQNIFKAINEIRRVCRKRSIIVVPKQRPYKYTLDLHLHFFPYKHSLLALMGSGRKNICKEVGGDLLYIEDRAR